MVTVYVVTVVTVYVVTVVTVYVVTVVTVYMVTVVTVYGLIIVRPKYNENFRTYIYHIILNVFWSWVNSWRL